MVRRFVVGYAASKDLMGDEDGWVHVVVAGRDLLDCRLAAEQMVAAVGLEPLWAQALDRRSGEPT